MCEYLLVVLKTGPVTPRQLIIAMLFLICLGANSNVKQLLFQYVFKRHSCNCIFQSIFGCHLSSVFHQHLFDHTTSILLETNTIKRMLFSLLPQYADLTATTVLTNQSMDKFVNARIFSL